MVVLRDGLPQRHQPQAVRVARPAVLERLLGRLADHRRRVEVGLAELEVDDVLALALELLRPLEDLDGKKGLDGVRALRRHCRARARRAASIWPGLRGPSLNPPPFEPGCSAQLIATSATR